MNETFLDCRKYIVCYKDSITSDILSMLFLFFASVFLMLGMYIVNEKLKKRIKKDKKLKKKFYE